MGFTDAMKSAGYQPKASTTGDKNVYKGIYKLLFVKGENKPDDKWPDGQPNPTFVGQFKVIERLAGQDVFKSDYPEVTGYYATSDELAPNRKKGIAKLIDGFLSVGISVTGTSDDETIANIMSKVGSAEVYMKLAPDWKNVQDAEGNWSKKKKDEDGIDVAPFQSHSFLTEANAKKLAKSQAKADGHPL